MPGYGFNVRIDNGGGRSRVVLTANRDIPDCGGVSDSESIGLVIRVKGQYSSVVGTSVQVDPNVRLSVGTYPAHVMDMLTGSTTNLALVTGTDIALLYAGADPDIDSNDALNDTFTYAFLMEATLPSMLTFKTGDELILFSIDYDPAMGDWELVGSQTISPVLYVMQSSREPYIGLSEGGLPYNQAKV